MPGPGVKLHEAEGLGRGGVDDLRAIEAEGLGHEGSSLARAMLTARNVFSKSLTISAAAVEETGTRVSRAAP